MTISFDYSNALPFMKKSEINYLSEFVKTAHNMLHEKKGPGSDFLGWVDLPIHYDKDEFVRIKEAAERIRNHSDALIVIGKPIRKICLLYLVSLVLKTKRTFL